MSLIGNSVRLALAAGLIVTAGAALAQKGETIKLGWIDPLSGLMAPVGQNQLKSYQFMAEHFSKANAAGVKFEIVPIDNKLSPQESTNAVKSLTDQGVRYIVQGNGSGACRCRRRVALRGRFGGARRAPR